MTVTPERATAKRRNRFRLLPNYATLGVLLVFALVPLLIIGFNSLKTTAEIGLNPLGLPLTPRWSNYAEAWDIGNFSTTTRNSGLLVLITVLGVVSLAGMAAYSMTKLKLPGVGVFMLYLLVGSSLPIQLFLVPLFFLWAKLGLTNNLFGLALIYVALNSPLAIFLLRSYMLQLPASLEDAARVDGANEWQVFSRIIVPLSWPAFLTVGLVVALGVWNEFLLATVFLTKTELFTVVTSYFNFSTRFGQDWGLTSAASMMMIVPIITIFLVLQRQFIEGLTQGGLKE